MKSHRPTVAGNALAALDREAKRALIEAAQTAPSGDNSQPLRFRWQHDRLRITVDTHRAAHTLNVRDTATLLTLGTTLEIVKIEASRFGLATRFDVTPAHGNEPPMATVSFVYDGRTRDMLAGYLTLRRTDRRMFLRGTVPASVLAASGAGFENATVHWLSRDSGAAPLGALGKVIAEVESEMWQHPAVHKDLYRWLRFGHSGAATGDGMPVATLALSAVERVAVRLGRSFTFQSVLNGLGGIFLVKRHTEKAIASSAALFCVSIPAPSPGFGSESLLDLSAAGRAGIRTWLELTAAGFGVQPHSLTALYAYCHAAGFLPQDGLRSEQAMTLGRLGLEALRSAFSLPEGRVPVWLFRTGDVRGLPAPAHCPRLPLSRVTD